MSIITSLRDLTLGVAFFAAGTSLLPASIPQLIPIQIEGKWGYCNPQREIVILAVFDAARPFDNGIGVVQSGYSMGAVGMDGKMLVPAAFDDVVPGKLIRLRRGGKLALASRNGRLLTPFNYEEILPRIGGLYEVRQDGFSGIHDSSGTLLVPVQYDDILCLRDTRGRNAWLIQVRENGKLGLYNYCGTMVQSPRFDMIGPFRNGYATTRIGSKFGMISQEGREVSPCIYDNILEMREDRAPAMVNGHWGFIDHLGNEVIPFNFEAVQEGGFFQGRAPVIQHGTWKFIDRFGNTEITIKEPYSYVGAISEGLMPACIVEESKMHYGYIASDGAVRIPFKYDFATPFTNGLAIVAKLDGGYTGRSALYYGIVNNQGAQILPLAVSSMTEAEKHLDSLRLLGWTWLETAGNRCRYDVHGRRRDCGKFGWEKLLFKFKQTRCEQASLVAVNQEGLWGYANPDAEVVIPCKYRMAECFSNGLAKVWPASGGNYFFIDSMGNEYAGG